MPLETKNHVTCTGCALLCDDIAIDTQFGSIQAVHNACLRGSKKFLPAGSKQLLKSPSIDGKESPYDDALAEAARILKAAKNVVIAGGTHGTSEAIEQLVSLATKLGAKMAIPDFDIYTQLTNAIKHSGIEFFTLGETVNNADMIVFWGANPIDLAPKLLVRAVFSRGRYRQSGKEVKKLAVIDDYPTPTMERADIKILVDGQDHEGVLKALSDTLIGQKASEQHTSDLAEAIKNCEYCAFFVGEGILNRQFLKAHPGFLDRLLQLVHALNGTRRATILPLSYSWNATGIFHELDGAGEKVECFDAQDLPFHVGKGDAIIAFGFDLAARCADNAMVKTNNIPVIAIDFKRTPTTDAARVVLPPAIPGIDTGGIATRLDGTAVLLHPPLQRADGKKTDVDILRALHGRA